MTKIKWLAKKGQLWTTPNADIALDSSTTYAAQVTASSSEASISAYIKDISITPPEMAVDLVHTTGEDANGFQNSFDEEKPSTQAKLTATLIMQGDEIFELGMTGTALAAGYTDYMFNSSKRTNLAYVLKFSDLVDEISIVLKNGYVKLGERKITGADGHWEQSIEVICSPSNYREQFKD
jgi:hypothetical protein